MNLNRWEWKCLNSWKFPEISGAVFWWNIRNIARWGKYFGIFIHPKTFPGKDRRGEFIAGIFTNSQRTVGGGIECRTFSSFSRRMPSLLFLPPKNLFLRGQKHVGHFFPLSRRDTPRRRAVNIMTDDETRVGKASEAHIFSRICSHSRLLRCCYP